VTTLSMVAAVWGSRWSATCDAHIGYVLGASTRAKDARRAAQHAAAAQEARAMLGAPETAVRARMLLPNVGVQLAAPPPLTWR
jgi:hypothetical protein